jgi:ZIP family zinc transporter
MLILLFTFALATFIFTILGGFFAYRSQDKLHLIISFSAGVLITAAFLDLLPEAFGLRGGGEAGLKLILLSAIAGFLVFHLVERLGIIANCRNQDCRNILHLHSVGRLSAASLIFHSLLDGVVIGLAFQAQLRLGILVGIAVLAHDWTDGVSVVAVLLPSNRPWREMIWWILADAITPVMGVFVFFVGFPPAILGIALAVVAGIFIYIAAANLLPEAHHRHSSIPTILATLVGFGLIFLLSRLI